jgi:hypothetical protein
MIAEHMQAAIIFKEEPLYVAGLDPFRSCVDDGMGLDADNAMGDVTARRPPDDPAHSGRRGGENNVAGLEAFAAYSFHSNNRRAMRPARSGNGLIVAALNDAWKG